MSPQSSLARQIKVIGAYDKTFMDDIRVTKLRKAV